MRLLASRYLTVALVFVTIASGLTLAAGHGIASGQSEARVTDTTALLTSNRSNLKICVESLIAEVKDEDARGRVKGAFTKIADHPDFEAAGLGNGPVTVDIGCPSEPTIDDPQLLENNRLGAPKLVREPSEYRLFVFAASTERISETFGDDKLRVTAQEDFCDQRCIPVTHAVYLTPEDLSDATFLESILSHGVGLWPVDEPKYDQEPPSEDPRGK